MTPTPTDYRRLSKTGRKCTKAVARMSGGATVFDGEKPRQLPYSEHRTMSNDEYERRRAAQAWRWFALGAVLISALAAWLATMK